MTARVVVAEPGLVAYGGFTPAEAEQHFDAFWALFEMFRDLVELNELQLVCSRDLYELMQALFPYEVLAYREGRQAGMREVAASLLCKFLDQRVRAPWLAWEGHDEGLQVAPLSAPPTGVYTDEYVRMTWSDVLGQVAASKIADVVFSTKAPFSFAPDGTEAVHVTPTGKPVCSLGIRCVSSDNLGPFLGPVPFRSLMARCPASAAAPKFVYEDGGHQPPKQIKRALERAATDAGKLVVRMNTTYRWPGAGRCKLQAQLDGQIEFTISDGDVLFRGQYSTRAQTAEELAVALQMLSIHYFRRCEEEGFPIEI